jgi:hypothetical protein
MAPDAVVGDSVARNITTKEKKGIKSLVLIALGAVVLISVAAVALGVANNDKNIEKVTNAVPGLSPTDADGWSTTTDPTCGITVDFPGERTQETTDGTTRWVATVGKDEALTVTCTDLDESQTKTTEQTAKEYLEGFARADATERGGEILRVTEQAVAGMQGIYVEGRAPMATNDILVARGADAIGPPPPSSWSRALYTVKDGKLFVVKIDGVSKEPVAWARFANSFRFGA